MPQHSMPVSFTQTFKIKFKNLKIKNVEAKRGKNRVCSENSSSSNGCLLTWFQQDEREELPVMPEEGTQKPALRFSFSVDIKKN